jgi:outer membrane lipoprotein-sorting protein
MVSLTASPGRVLALTLAIAVAVTVAVVAVQPSPAGDTAPQPFPEATVDERLAALDGLAATKVTVVEHGDDSSRTVERLRLRPDTGAFRAVTPGGNGSERRVANESVLWIAERDDEVFEIQRLRADTGSRIARVKRLIARARRASGETATASAPRTPGVAPLPRLPAATSRLSGTAPRAGAATP